MSCPPRISVVPPAVRSKGPHVAALAEVAGVRLDASQRLVLDAFCGTAADGRWSAFQCVVFQPRQNGKSEILLARALAGLVLFGEQVLFSAHQARATGALFRRLRRAVEGAPELGARVKKATERSGAETLELESGARLECVARSSGSGRGFTADTAIFDEAQYLTGQQMEDVLPSLSAVKNPQIVFALSQGNEESEHLAALRARALAAEPDPRTCWLEWSLAPGARVDDPATWAAANPAMEAGRISAAYVADELRALGPAGFARERLGQSAWPVDSTGKFAVISRAAWEACQVRGVSTDGGRVSLGVATSRLGESAAVVACSSPAGGTPVIEMLGWRPGQRGGWVAPYVAELAARHQVDVVVWDDDSAARELGLAVASRARADNPGPGEFPKACMRFLEVAEERGLAHLGDPVLSAAVGGAVARNTRAGWYFSGEPYGAEVLAAAVLALYGYRSRMCPYDLVASVG